MGIRERLDRLAPQFEKGGRYERFSALYEAVDTALYSPGFTTRGASHVRDSLDLKRIMITVWLCTFPAMFVGWYAVGYSANEVLARMPEFSGTGDWHEGLIRLFAGHDPTTVPACVSPPKPSSSVASGRSCSHSDAGTRSTKGSSSPASCSHSRCRRRYRCGR